MNAIEDAMPSPTKTGEYGRAWRIDVPAIVAVLGRNPAENALIDGWIVEATWAHPLWHSYYLSLVHLRPMPSLGAPLIYRSDATHEFLVHAMDPSQERAAQIDRSQPKWLVPTNFGAQLAEASDTAASSTIECAVDMILNGELNPDTDARAQWKVLFGDAMMKRAWATPQ